MRCTILGCGGSLGVPQLLCSCYVCTSKNPKNIRKRTSIFIEQGGTNILIDTSQDFKIQAQMYKIDKINGLLLTHEHSDHICGINDIKPYWYSSDGKIDAYLNKQTFDSISGTFSYLFKNNSSIHQPILNPIVIDDYSEFTVGNVQVSSFLQHHGQINSLGYRFGNFAYSTDFNALPQKSIEALRGIDTWVIGCLRYGWSPTHLSVEQALDYIEIIKPKRAFFTHMSHDIDFDEITKILSPNVRPAYDGMVIELE